MTPLETDVNRSSAVQTNHAPILQGEEVSVRFGGLLAVEDLTFSLWNGEIVGLIGPNGAGKTTLFNAISRQVPLTGGRISMSGQDLSPLPPHAISALGISRTFQNTRVFAHLSVLENVLIGAHHTFSQSTLSVMVGTPRSRRQEKAQRQACRELLHLLGMSRYENQRAKSLSYAWQRRLEIARALASGPKLLMLDEPCAGMNPSESAALVDFIRAVLERFRPVIFVVEHDMHVIRRVTDRIIALNSGRQIAEGTPQEVLEHPAVVEAYLGKDNGNA